MPTTKREEHRSNPLEIELLAIFCGQLCVPLGIHTLVVESDSLLAIRAVTEGENSCMQYSNILIFFRSWLA